MLGTSRGSTPLVRVLKQDSTVGLFDSIYLECPVCKATVEVQSKAADGGPRMNVFPADEVPVSVAADIHGEVVWCTTCKKRWEVAAKKLKPVYRVRLVEHYQDEE